MSLRNPEHAVQMTMRLVESEENSAIRLNANGGNSILVVCEPQRELEYIQAIQSLMQPEKYNIIDLTSILSNFVAQNRADIEAAFDLLQGSTQQVFKAPVGEEGTDLFGMILEAINQSQAANKFPVLINTGVLYGTGIGNIHIMESEQVMRAPLPLVILYPATREQDTLLYLGKRHSSKYRCMIVE